MTAATAHPDDLLLIAYAPERHEYEGFDKRQVIAVGWLPQGLYGRRFRRLFVTDRAAKLMDASDWQAINVARAASPYGEIVPASLYRPQPIPTAWDRLRQTFTELIARYG